MRRHLIAFLAIALTACAKQDDAETLQKSTESWSATLQFVADARLRNDARRGYTLKTIEAAIEDLSAEIAKPGMPKPVTLRAERIIGIAAMLQRAVENDDRAAIAKARRELAGAR